LRAPQIAPLARVDSFSLFTGDGTTTYGTLGKVPAIAVIVFAMLFAVWHFTIAAHPEWRAGWHRE
jgi:hypothetical protein